MIRIGLGLHGYLPPLPIRGRGDGGRDAARPGEGTWRSSHATPSADDASLPVLRWLARIIHIQHYPAGASVSYGRTYRLTRESVLGVVPVCYADGYPLNMSNQGTACVTGGNPDGCAMLAPVLGKVCMDQIVT
ncbi:MAG: alanine racemase C-terminal domain-containing protein [Phycisphaeraceae bacterium]